MSDLGDTYSAMREHNKQKKVQNLKSTTEILDEAEIEYTVLSEHHYRIGEFELWPSTGKWVHRKSNKYGRGIFNLLKRLRRKEGV